MGRHYTNELHLITHGNSPPPSLLALLTAAWALFYVTGSHLSRPSIQKMTVVAHELL